MTVMLSEGRGGRVSQLQGTGRIRSTLYGASFE